MPSNLGKISSKAKTRGKWSDEDLVKAIDCYDVGYKISDYVKAFNIPRSSLRDHLSRKTTIRTIGPKTKQEERMVITNIDDMLEIGQPLTPQMLKLKVEEKCQGGETPFKEGIPRDSCLYWFKTKAPSHESVTRVRNFKS